MPPPATIRPCDENDFEDLFEIINDGARAYKGVIPADRWREPYMSRRQLRDEIDAGVRFSGLQDGASLLGVMGIQDKGEVFLIRHAYVRTAERNTGIGGRLLQHLRRTVDKPVLIGTWKAAHWAISFYEKHGYRLVDETTKTRLLNTYWSIPARQVDTSVVLADEAWWMKP